MSDTLIVDRKDGYAVLTMNRPNAMNALNEELRTAISKAARALQKDDDIRVIILTGAGERAFTAGLDLKELGQSSGISGAVGEDPVRALRRFKGPIICAINGVAITGGFELALAGDVLIGSTNARFADTHARVGIMPGWGLSQKLSRLIGISRAKELSLTGNFLSAEMAERWGLLNRVTAPEELLAAAEQMAQDMLSCDPDMLLEYKTLIDDGFDKSFGKGMKIETQRNRDYNKQVSGDAIEERRKKVQERGRAQKG